MEIYLSACTNGSTVYRMYTYKGVNVVNATVTIKVIFLLIFYEVFYLPKIFTFLKCRIKLKISTFLFTVHSVIVFIFRTTNLVES